ncbi:putative pectate lyase D [Phytophthora citrophthora]|uniref:Probable pectate lyase F n=1 Tax=Phytophthora citrophthora TaxID=4793 RepID=A0AAD9LD45_9STRA|nr:putative pectate lyase D [Phytophthora citrophthora]
MVKAFVPFAASVALLVAAATATTLPDGSWPASTGTVQYAEAYVIKAGEVFDGKMQTFERSDVSCEGQTESGANTAVFKMEPGSTLKNAIIGKNQMEGVHCDKHDCTIENVWWDDVCEDALSIKGGTASSVSKVIGCGARYADDKVIQHNGYGTVEIDGFYGEDISKLYRSCGTCGDRPKKVSVSNVYVVDPGNAIVTVNKNWGDEATLSNIWVKSSKPTVKICQWSQGNANGEPKVLGNGPSPPLCQYSESDVHINEDISQAAQKSPSSTSSGSDPTQQTAASASTASSGTPTQTATSGSASTASSVASSASASSSSQNPTQASSSSQNPTQASSASASSSSQNPTQASSSSQNPTQASSGSTTSSSLGASASASYQGSSNSSTDASEAAGPGTVAPVENGSFEESVVSSDASQTQQQEDTNTPSVASSSSSSQQSSSSDASQTPDQQSSVASSNANGSTASSRGSTSASTTQDSSSSKSQTSSNGSANQNSATGSASQASNSDSPVQTATNTTGSVPDGTWPASTGTVQYAEAYVIKAGEVFDGKMQTFERSDVSCEGQTESGANTAVFKMEPGSTLKNAIIGKNQMEGVHCDKHDCTIENVWWDDVCEDALSIKGGTASSVSKVIGCGARYADDKVIQHNGYGTVEIDGFYGEDISKLYRSCGTCGDRPKKVSVSNSYVVNPGNAIVTVNKNWGDEATLSNIWVKSSKPTVKICQWSQGNANGEPKVLGNGPSPPLCQYSESDVHINEK